MSAFWFKFKKFIKYQFKSGNPWLHTFLFVASLSVFSVAVNTSFHVMGVDISEFRSLIYGLIPLILKDLSGVLFVSYAFFPLFPSYFSGRTGIDTPTDGRSAPDISMRFWERACFYCFVPPFQNILKSTENSFIIANPGRLGFCIF